MSARARIDVFSKLRGAPLADLGFRDQSATSILVKPRFLGTDNLYQIPHLSVLAADAGPSGERQIFPHAATRIAPRAPHRPTGREFNLARYPKGRKPVALSQHRNPGPDSHLFTPPNQGPTGSGLRFQASSAEAGVGRPSPGPRRVPRSMKTQGRLNRARCRRR